MKPTDQYWPLFKHLSDTYQITATESEMDDIRRVCAECERRKVAILAPKPPAIKLPKGYAIFKPNRTEAKGCKRFYWDRWHDVQPSDVFHSRFIYARKIKKGKQ